MKPGSLNQDVIGIGTILFDSLVRLQSPKTVFSVKPTAHGHHCRFDILKTGKAAARLPEFIISAVLHHFIPESYFAFEVFFVGIGQWTHFHKELITIRCGEFKSCRPFGGELRLGCAHEWPKTEERRQRKRAVMVYVITHKPVGNRRLRGNCFKRRMCIYGAHGSVKTRIWYSPDAYIPIVVWDVIYEPLDRIIGVAALINIRWTLLIGNVRSHIYKFAFGHKPTPHILKYKNKLVFREMFPFVKSP